MTQRSVVSAALACVVLVVGCSEKAQRTKRLSRRGDAAAVVLVDRKSERGPSDFRAEVEPNDKPGKSVALPFAVRGTMKDESDLDHYVVTPKADGMLAATLTGAEDADLRIAVLGKKDKPRYLADRGPAGTEEALPNIPVQAGVPVVFRISEFISKREQKLRKRKKSKPRAGASKPYSLAMHMVEARPGDEIEPNEKPDGAVKLMLGDQGNGYFGWSKDRDTWRIALDGFNKSYGLDIDVRVPAAAKVTLEVTTLDGKKVVTRSGEKGASIFVRGLRSEGASEFRLQVSSSRAAPVDRYQVVANSRRLDDGDEVEPNDSSETASALGTDDAPTKGVFRGFLVAGDRDVLKLRPAKGPSILDVALDPSATVDAKLFIRVGGKTIAEINGGGVGATERSGAIPVEAGQSITLVVEGTFRGDTPNPYRLTWSVEAANDDPSDLLE